MAESLSLSASHCLDMTEIMLKSGYDSWMTCHFTSFSTVFQSYQDDGRLIMKGNVHGTPFMVEILPQVGIELSPLDQ